MSTNRVLPDFLTSYTKYTTGTESAKVFHTWVGISIISAALRKKVKLNLGRLNVYPNMYIVLVAEPGKARKSVSISYGTPILKSIEDIKVSADAITREALIQDLETCAVDSPMPDGTMFKHSSLAIISTEFESFLGQKTENAKMLILLTDLFDCAQAPWEYRTKGKGTNIIPSVYLSILGATTPESLSITLPSQAIGGGLTSRIMFIWADKKEAKVPIPIITPEIIELKSKLQQDLFLISQIAGNYILTKNAATFWIDWYLNYEDLDINRICTDPSFNSWYSRKPMAILKVAMIYAASESNHLSLHTHHIQKAITTVTSIETGMGNAFRSVGRSTITAEIDTVISIIRVNKTISEKNLMKIVWRDLDSQKFTNVIQTIISTGRVKRIVDVHGNIFYEYVED